MAGIRRFTEVLIEGGWVSPEILQEAERRESDGTSLAQYLLEAGYLTEEALSLARARQYGLPSADLISVEAEASLLKCLPCSSISRIIV